MWSLQSSKFFKSSSSRSECLGNWPCHSRLSRPGPNYLFNLPFKASSPSSHTEVHMAPLHLHAHLSLCLKWFLPSSLTQQPTHSSKDRLNICSLLSSSLTLPKSHVYMCLLFQKRILDISLTWYPHELQLCLQIGFPSNL